MILLYRLDAKERQLEIDKSYGAAFEEARNVQGLGAAANLLEFVLLCCLVFACFSRLSIELLGGELHLGVSELASLPVFV